MPYVGVDRAEAEHPASLRGQVHSRADVAAARSHAALHADVLAAPAHLAEARAGAIRLAARRVLLLRAQRAAWVKRLRELLAGDRAHPDGEILLGPPGPDVRLAARVPGETGERRERFPTPAAVQSYAGTAPVTKVSGRARVVVARTACNRFLRQALLRRASCSLTTSALARPCYDRHRQGGEPQHAALRCVAHRRPVIPRHLLATGQRHEEEIHQRNRAHPHRHRRLTRGSTAPQQKDEPTASRPRARPSCPPQLTTPHPTTIPLHRLTTPVTLGVDSGRLVPRLGMGGVARRGVEQGGVGGRGAG